VNVLRNKKTISGKQKIYDRIDQNLNKNFSPNTFDTNEYISNDINIPTVSNIQKNSFESYNRLSSNNSTDIVNGDFTNKFMEIIASDKNKNSENRNTRQIVKQTKNNNENVVQASNLRDAILYKSNSGQKSKKVNIPDHAIKLKDITLNKNNYM
jgi:hypothetical protein